MLRELSSILSLPSRPFPSASPSPLSTSSHLQISPPLSIASHQLDNISSQLSSILARLITQLPLHVLATEHHMFSCLYPSQIIHSACRSRVNISRARLRTNYTLVLSGPRSLQRNSAANSTIGAASPRIPSPVLDSASQSWVNISRARLHTDYTRSVRPSLSEADFSDRLQRLTPP